MTELSKNRISSIDLLRGVVMILMALDHVRDYFHYDAFFFDPTDVSQTNLALFFTRFITHYCAPVFVFLAGTSAFFVGQRRDKRSLSTWLLKRGLWLIFVELTIVKVAWYFKFNPMSYELLVIWVLGAAMIFLAGVIHLPKKLAISLCVIVILGHNAFDGFNPEGNIASILWSVFHVFNLNSLGEFQIFVGYPLIPWIFVMPLGYYFGELYLPSVDKENRIKMLMKSGVSMVVLFVLLRVINIYGDPNYWVVHDTWSKSLMSFVNVTKYPPSLFYLLITIGPSLIFLALAEKLRGKLADTVIVFGRVPMFFYILHLYVIHAAGVLAAVFTGFKASDMISDVWITESAALDGYGFSLWVVYLVWILIVLGLYPVCSWYNSYKSNNRDKWWLSYL